MIDPKVFRYGAEEHLQQRLSSPCHCGSELKSEWSFWGGEPKRGAGGVAGVDSPCGCLMCVSLCACVLCPSERSFSECVMWSAGGLRSSNCSGRYARSIYTGLDVGLRFFCGLERYCYWKGRREEHVKVLTKAVKNLEGHAFVGVTEELELTLLMLRQRLPGYFGGLFDPSVYGPELKLGHKNKSNATAVLKGGGGGGAKKVGGEGGVYEVGGKGEEGVKVRRSGRVSEEALAALLVEPRSAMAVEFYRLVRAMFWDAVDRCLGVSEAEVAAARGRGLRLPEGFLERMRGEGAGKEQ